MNHGIIIFIQSKALSTESHESEAIWSLVFQSQGSGSKLCYCAEIRAVGIRSVLLTKSDIIELNKRVTRSCDPMAVFAQSALIPFVTAFTHSVHIFTS